MSCATTHLVAQQTSYCLDSCLVSLHGKLFREKSTKITEEMLQKWIKFHNHKWLTRRYQSSQSPLLNSTRTTDESQLTMGSDLPSLVAKPFHFLIQEQAKCLVAVKELQDQVQSLSHFRKVVTKSFPEIVNITRSNMQWPKNYTSTAGRLLPTLTNGSRHHHSSSSTESVELDAGSIKNKNKTRNNSTSNNASQKFVVVAQGKNWLRIRPYTNADSELDDSDNEPMSTCDSLCSNRRKHNGRQDSGFSTEPQADKSLVMMTPWTGPQSKDELLSLLDVIEAQSIELKSELERPAATRVDNGQQEIADNSSQSSAIQFLRREKDELAERLLVSEERSLTAHVRTSQLEERLRTAATEREQLDMRIHGMHMQFVRPCGSSIESAESGGGVRSADSLLRGKVHVKPNPGRLAAVLRETRVLELQKQLLMSVMENEVLKTQLEHVNKDWSRRTREWHRELDLAHNEARAAKAGLDRARLELQSEKARLRMLQRVLQTAPTLDGGASVNGHLVHSLHALGQSFADHFKDKATNTDEKLSNNRTSNKTAPEPSHSNDHEECKPNDDIFPSSSPASMTSPDSTQDENCKEKWRSTPNLIDFNEESKGLVNNVKNGVSKTSDPAIQQRIQNFLQRISEHLKPMEIMPDDSDYLETIL
uniref:Uncharacterized protein n=1 Tax=Strigamia maritima TaxID=126957 RepID=T1JJV5_STRMM